jgi:hypothetical protein
MVFLLRSDLLKTLSLVLVRSESFVHVELEGGGVTRGVEADDDQGAFSRAKKLPGDWSVLKIGLPTAALKYGLHPNTSRDRNDVMHGRAVAAPAAIRPISLDGTPK